MSNESDPQLTGIYVGTNGLKLADQSGNSGLLVSDKNPEYKHAQAGEPVNLRNASSFRLVEIKHQLVSESNLSVDFKRAANLRLSVLKTDLRENNAPRVADDTKMVDEVLTQAFGESYAAFEAGFNNTREVKLMNAMNAPAQPVIAAQAAVSAAKPAHPTASLIPIMGATDGAFTGDFPVAPAAPRNAAPTPSSRR